MEIAGEQRIAAPREAVWAALNDPGILRRCIPGCQSLDKVSDTEMTAVAVIKVGPVSARFQGAVTLTDLDPPNGYRIVGEGQGGVAGFAKGAAEVRLVPDGADTLLRYTVSAQIGGKLAQLGGRLIDATARKMADAFFREFAEAIARTGEAPTPASPSAPAEGKASPPSPARVRPAAAGAATAPGAWLRMGPWVNAAALLLAALVMLGTFRAGGPATGAASPDFALAAGFVLVLLVGYLLGRQHAAAAERADDRALLLALLAERRARPE